MKKNTKFFKTLFERFKAICPFILRGGVLACVVTLIISLFAVPLEQPINSVTASAVTEGTAPFPTPDSLINSRWLIANVNATGSTNTWTVTGTFSWDDSIYSNINTAFTRVRLYPNGRLIFWTDGTASQNFSNITAIYNPTNASWEIVAGFTDTGNSVLVTSTPYLIFEFSGGSSVDSSGFRSLITNNGVYIPDYCIYIYNNQSAYIYDVSAITYYGDLVRGYPNDFAFLTAPNTPVPEIKGSLPVVHLPTSTILLRGSIGSEIYEMALGGYQFIPGLYGRIDTLMVSSVSPYMNFVYNAGSNNTAGFNPMTVISSMVTSALQLEIFPNFRLYYFLLIGFGVGLLAFFERMFLG